jgi:hypothetical protein
LPARLTFTRTSKKARRNKVSPRGTGEALPTVPFDDSDVAASAIAYVN